MDRSNNHELMLEYFEKGHQFHYNRDVINTPSDDYYRPLGWCTFNEADVFTRIVNPMITKNRYDDPDVSFDRVKESFDEFCSMIEKDELKL